MAKSKKRGRGAPRKVHNSVLWLGGAALLAFGLFLGVQIAKPPPPPDFARPAPGEAGPADPSPEVRREATPPEPAAVEAKSRPVPPVSGSGRPRISIVIDDLGRSLEEIDTLGRLGVPITYAVLPFESRTPEVVAELARRGAEVLCHLPMEAKGGANPGPGALRSGMGASELETVTRQALAAVPSAVGVNNHMGSEIAADRQALAAVMGVVAEQGLYFLDSRTSADTQAFTVARETGIPAAERQVFLDTIRDRVEIAAQFDRLLTLAEQKGSAIVIAHPYGETLEVLAEKVPEALAKGFEFVPVSALLER